MSNNPYGELDSASATFESGYVAAGTPDWGDLFDGGYQEMPKPPVEQMVPPVEKSEAASLPAEAPAQLGFHEQFSAKLAALESKLASFSAKVASPIQGVDHTPRLTRMNNGDELTQAGMLLFG